MDDAKKAVDWGINKAQPAINGLKNMKRKVDEKAKPFLPYVDMVLNVTGGGRGVGGPKKIPNSMGNILPNSRWIERNTYNELKRLGLNKQFANAMKKGLANTRQNDNGIIILTSNERVKHKGYTYTFKLKVAKAPNHVRVYGRLDSKGNLVFDYITSGKK
jgi:hypothetical protein